MAAAHLLGIALPALVAEAYAQGFADGHRAGFAAGCTGIPHTRDGALRVIDRTRKGWPHRCRYCAGWHVHLDQERERDMGHLRYQRPQAVPCVEPQED